MNEAVVLCGGLGTRLRDVIGKRPKILAPVGDDTFLDYLFFLLSKRYFIDHLVLALGYEHNQIIEYLNKKSFDVDISYSIEITPLGTGGALKKAIKLVKSDNFLLVNGDTYFLPKRNFDWEFFKKLKEFPIQIFSVYMEDTSRFGRIEFKKINNHSCIARMKEKGLAGGGWINTGYYIIQKKKLEKLFRGMSKQFSFELWLEEVIEKGLEIPVWKLEGYFIDIGVPKDYFRFKDFIKNIEGRDEL